MEPGFSLMAYFELILTLLVLVSGVIYLLDICFWAKARAQDANAKMSWAVEYSRSFFPVLFFVLVIRSFLFEPFRIPSGSLKPTLKVGDFILVSKYTYGLRLPVLHTKVLSIHEPKRGDIVVFRSVTTANMDLIKRIVGVPGDVLSYVNKVLYVNGKPMKQSFVKKATDQDEAGLQTWPVLEETENLDGIIHNIYIRPDVNESGDFHDVVVPPGMYFAMGDNRDNSNDSRFWGFVPEQNIIGKADTVLLSWSEEDNTLRWKRFWQKIV